MKELDGFSPSLTRWKHLFFCGKHISQIDFISMEDDDLTILDIYEEILKQYYKQM